jgi:hypothetical protein
MAIRINGDNTTAAPGITRGDDTDTGIQFGTDEVSIVTGGVERAKVDNAGRLDVNSGSSGVISAKQNTNNGGFNIYEGKDSTGSTKFYVTHNGRVGASEGVIFGTDTAAANILDDYEEGTFTPNFATGTFTYGNRAGRYTKIGNQVTAHFLLSWTAKSGSGALQVALPFVTGGSVFDRYCGALGYLAGIDNAGNKQLNATTSGNGSPTVTIYIINDNTTPGATDVGAMNGSGEFQLSITYNVA